MIRHTVWRLLAAGAIAAQLPSVASAQEEQAQQAPAPAIPPWFLEDIEFMTRDGGRWVADNDDASQPYQRWGMEWTAAPDGASMTGRLYGFADGVQSEDFFQFRQFWHPGENRAVVMQWGGGGWFGTGELRQIGDWSLLEQVFVVPGGQTFGVGHVARREGDDRVTEQYDVVAGQGVWRLNSSNTWRRAAEGG